jgi:cleavage and polyadenylation specificity factor subunit 2
MRLQGVFRDTTKTKPVIYLEHMSRDTLGVGRSHLGWMNIQDNKVFQDIDENPINFQYIREVFTLKEYRQVINAEGDFEGPRIVVTSMNSLEYGFSRNLLKEFLARPRNEILFL